MKDLIRMKRMLAIVVALFAIVTTASAQWTTYDASILPGEADWNVKNGSGDTAIISLVDDAENAGNTILQFISGSADKNTLEAPKFDSKVSNGGTKQAFTVVMRARAYKFSDDSTYTNFMEVEVKDGEIRDKVRFYPTKGLDIEKANSKELKAYPDGHDSYEFNIYRITFKDGITKVYINDVLADSSATASTTSSDADSRFVLGDSNSGADYGVEYDWVIWDNGDAYAPGEGEDYPEGIILAPLVEDEVGDGDWTVFAADTTFEKFGFTEGSSSDFGGDVNVIDDVENAGNSLVELVGSDSLKNYWKYYLADSAAVADVGVTIVTRMKALNEEENVAAIQITTGAYYAKVYVTSDGKLKVDGDQTYPTELDYSEYHVFRVTMKGNLLSVWVDDVKYCNAYEVTSTSSNSPSFRIGDASTSTEYSAVVDWIIWDETGAYAPTEGSDYPSSLILDPLTGGEVANFLYFDDASIAVDQAGETVDAGLEANADWILASVDTWLEISPVAGDSGVANFTIIAEENTGAAPRTGTIYGLIGEDLMDKLTITQEGQAVEIDALSAMASSEQLKDGVYKEAELAIDGYDSTAWVYEAGIVNGASEWIKVAVPSGSEVVMVKIMEYKNDIRLTAFSVEYWNGSEYVQILEPQLSVAQSAANTEMAFSFPSTVTTDTIKINFYGNTATTETDPTVASGWLTISEVSIWGEAVPTAINTISPVEFNVYPNPSTGSFTIRNAEGANVQVISLAGRVMFIKKNISNLERLDLDLNSGIYLLNVDGAVSKIVIKE